MVNATPRSLYHWETDPVHIIQEDEWASGLVWTGAEELAPPGFDPRTIHPAAGRYSDYAIPAPIIYIYIYIYININTYVLCSIESSTHMFPSMYPTYNLYCE